MMGVCSHKMVSPSEQVDHVWHIHLAHNQNYPEVIKILMKGKKRFDHVPSRGGKQQANLHEQMYEKSLTFYEFLFG